MSQDASLREALRHPPSPAARPWRCATQRMPPNPGWIGGCSDGIGCRDRAELLGTTGTGEAPGLAGRSPSAQPSQEDYWVAVHVDDDHRIQVGRYMVTNAEWLQFLSSGQYENDALWTAEGLAWRNSDRPSWQELASDPESAPLIVPNQPVVGVSWFEAHAQAHGARRWA